MTNQGVRITKSLEPADRVPVWDNSNAHAALWREEEAWGGGLCGRRSVEDEIKGFIDP